MEFLNVGESWVYTATYTVTQPEIDSNGGGDGVINNTATVDCDQLEPKEDTEEVSSIIHRFIPLIKSLQMWQEKDRMEI